MRKNTLRYFVVLALSIIHATACSQSVPYSLTLKNSVLGNQFKLLPIPKKIEPLQGKALSASALKNYFLDGVENLPPVDKSFPALSATKTPGKGTLTLSIGNAAGMSASKEAYVLEINNDQVMITANHKAGLLYGCQTLNQLLQDARDQKINIPSCRITDHPDIDYRAIHLDLKHHLDSLSYYYNMMDRLAALKVNAVMIEFEDKLKYKGAPVVGASHAISIEEFTKLSNYAQERNIEVSPLIQGLGHASYILKHPEYKELRDDSASDWSFDPLHPKTYEVQFSLYKDAMDATPHGKYLHIGGDEVGKLGLSDRAKKSGMTPFQLQMHWLKKVCEFAQQHNRIPVFWDDMVFKLSNLYPTTYDPSISEADVVKQWNENEKILNESLDLFPKNCVYMRWNYDFPKLPGNIKAMDWYMKNGLNVMAATAGQQIWAMMPRASSNFQAVKDFAQLTAEKKLVGIFLTLWDDASPHFETYWRSIHNFALFTWNFTDVKKEEAHAQFRHRFYGPAVANSSFAFQDSLEQALLFWEKALINKGQRETYPKKIDTLTLPDAASPGTWSVANKERLENARAEIARHKVINQRITRSLASAKRNKYALEYFKQLNDLQIYPSELLLTLEKYDRASAQQKKQAAAAVKAFAANFSSLRKKFENTFTKTRMLQNPPGYLMDQNHHHHLANGTVSSDWMYVYELAIIEKIKNQLTE